MYMREVKEKTVDQYHTATRWGSLEEQALSQKKKTNSDCIIFILTSYDVMTNTPYG